MNGPLLIKYIGMVTMSVAAARAPAIGEIIIDPNCHMDGDTRLTTHSAEIINDSTKIISVTRRYQNDVFVAGVITPYPLMLC